MNKRSISKAASEVQVSPEAGPELRFAIDPAVIEARGREATVVLESRLCKACRAEVKSSKTTKKVQFADLRKLIRQHCQNDPEFFTPHLSIVETAFRLLLLAARDPVSLGALHERITQLWMDSPSPRHISAEDLGRMLLHDAYYGIVEVKPVEAKA